MNPTLTPEVISILNQAHDMTIATVREDGYPQATAVSYVNDGLTIYFGCAAEFRRLKTLPAATRSRSRLISLMPAGTRSAVCQSAARPRLSPTGRRGTEWRS